MEEDNQQGPVAAVSLQQRIPTFTAYWQENPLLWFTQFEAVTASTRLTGSQKTQLVIANLDHDALRLVGDIILSPETDKYAALRERLTQSYGLPPAGQLRALFSSKDCNQSPSTLLADLRTRASGLLTEEALRLVWLEKLPSEIRAAAIAGCHDLNAAAKYATEAWYMNKNSSFTEINTLSAELQELRSEVATLRARNTSRFGRFSRKSRSRSNSPQRRLCYFHRKFGNRARNCQPPCDWSKNAQ